MLVLSLYAQYGLGYTALGAGLVITPVAAGNVAGALAALRLAPRIGGRGTIGVNLAVAIAGLASVALISAPPGGLALAGPARSPSASGSAGSSRRCSPTILAGVTPAEAGSAAGSLGAIQQLAGSVGVAVIASLYAATAHPAARGLAVAALAAAALLGAGGALTLLLPPARAADGDADRAGADWRPARTAAPPAGRGEAAPTLPI